MNERTYFFDDGLRVWRTPTHKTIAYSDGSAVEEQLLGILRHCNDLSSFSRELRGHITDWPTEYHFSHARQNVLRPFQIGPGMRVLEIGCGCGAITRYLGETGATVIAVEGSELRASIAAERCRDLQNVSIYCDNLATFIAKEKFDFVTLIGVLEYAPMFIAAPGDPITECLSHARRHLSDNGELILAIENQIGLKYLNGHPEDHIGRPFFGVQDLYEKGSPITFGKNELISRLANAGFVNIELFYPFPDYKIPSVIISQSGFQHPHFQPEQLIARCRSLTNGKLGECSFQENLVLEPLARNKLIPDLSNSFLVRADQATNNKSTTPQWLAAQYSNKRDPEYAVETTFVERDSNIAVCKRRLFPSVLPQMCQPRTNSLRLIHAPSPEAIYVSGKQYLLKLQRLLASQAEISAVAEWASPWVHYLWENSIESACMRLLPGQFIDSIPDNFLLDESGTLKPVDDEWRIEGDIPYAWVVIRGLVHSLNTCDVPHDIRKLTLIEFVNMLLGTIDLPIISADDIQLAARMEDEFQSVICGQARRSFSYQQALVSGPISDWLPLPDDLRANLLDAQRVSQALKATLESMETSLSWRLTKPLRYARRLLEKVGNATNSTNIRHK